MLIKRIKLKFFTSTKIILPWLILAIYLGIGLNRCLPMRCYSDEADFIRGGFFIFKKNSEIYYQAKLTWGHPAQITTRLISLGGKLLYIKGRLSGKINNLDQFTKKLKNNHLVELFWIGRIINLFFSLGTVYLTYRLSKKLLGEKKKKDLLVLTAIISLVTNGVFLIFVKFTRMDIPQTFFILLALLFLTQPSKNQFRLKINLFFFGISLGLATMSKWPSLVLFPLSIIVILPLLFSQPKLKKKIKFLFLYSFTALLGFLIGTLIASPVWPKYILQIKRDVLSEARPHHLGADGLSFWGNLFFYQQVFLTSFSIVLYIFFLIGLLKIVSSFSKKPILKQINSPQKIIFFGFFIYLIFISLLKLHWSRWIIPLLPLFSIIAALGLNSFLTKIKNNYLKALILFLTFITPFTKALIYTKAITNSDNRILSKNWINYHLSGKKIAYEGYTSGLPNGPRSLGHKSINFYIENNYQYLVVSSAMYERYLAEPRRYQKNASFYKNLFQKHHLVIVFPKNPIPQSYQRNFLFDHQFWLKFLASPGQFLLLPLGPEIRIYKIN